MVSHWFNARFRAQFVRIIPTLFTSPTNTPCMRAELHGCDTGKMNLMMNKKYVQCHRLLVSVVLTEIISYPDLTADLEMWEIWVQD